MIHVAGLSKNFGPIRALDRISFQVNPGEILGFLGPNGAGKTTALRILTGFLPADAGTAQVAGCDVHTQSLKVRALTGYLPEGVPLYPEQRVSEYLRFRARLKGVSRSQRRTAITRVLEQAGIRDVERRIVGTLSRGYRQRVGLADALLGDPPILILDEPTVGLDPEQVRHFRSLLRELGKSRTVIFSTHILTEVEQVANRITIIVKGRIAAEDSAENLRQRLGALDRVYVEVAGAPGSPFGPRQIAREIQGLPGVDGIRVEQASAGRTEGERPISGGKPSAGPVEEILDRGPQGIPLEFNRFTIRPRRGTDPRAAIYQLARDRGWILRELTKAPLSLEEIFLEIISEDPGEQKRGVRR